MRLDGGFRELEFRCDLAVLQAADDQVKDTNLLRGQLLNPLAQRPRRLGLLQRGSQLQR